MSKILLYFSLIITTPNGLGGDYEFGLNSNIDNTVFESVQTESHLLENLFVSDGGVELLSIESDTAALTQLSYIYTLYQHPLFSNSPQNTHLIRAPPVTA